MTLDSEFFGLFLFPRLWYAGSYSLNRRQIACLFVQGWEIKLIPILTKHLVAAAAPGYVLLTLSRQIFEPQNVQLPRGATAGR